MGLLSISSFLLAVEWWLPWKLIQTRAKSLYNPISFNSPSPPHLTLASVGSSFLSYVGKSCDRWGTRKEVLHNLSQPLDTKSEPAVATDSVDTLVREWRSERDPYLIFTEDLPRLSRQSVECVGAVHLFSAHLPSNYMEFHKVLSSFVIQQKLSYLRKESQFLPSLWWFGGEKWGLGLRLWCAQHQEHQSEGTAWIWALSGTDDFPRVKLPWARL